MTQKVKAVRNRRHARLLRGEFQTAFPQALLHQGADVLCEERRCVARDHDVIRISDKIALRVAASSSFGIRLLYAAFEAV
jgi:hypothetical protein